MMINLDAHGGYYLCPGLSLDSIGMHHWGSYLSRFWWDLGIPAYAPVWRCTKCTPEHDMSLPKSWIAI